MQLDHYVVFKIQYSRWNLNIKYSIQDATRLLRNIQDATWLLRSIQDVTRLLRSIQDVTRL